MRFVEIVNEIGIFFDRCDWENGSAYEAMDEMRSIIPRNKLKFDRDLLCWFASKEMLDKIKRLVKRYDQTDSGKIEWEWDQKELKSKKKNDLYVWLYKQSKKVIKYPKLRGANNLLKNPTTYIIDDIEDKPKKIKMEIVI